MNPLSDFFKAKDGSRLSEEAARTVKTGFYWRDYGNVKALKANGRRITLGEKGAKLENVDFVAGLWRVQTKFPHEITHVRDKDMVLMNKIQHTESTNFEYWTAKLVGYNCYGPFVIEGNRSDFIVSHCVVGKNEFWGYGTTIESARAFLGLKIWDEMRDVIHAAVFNNAQQDKTK